MDMPQKRHLEPITIYLPPDVIRQYKRLAIQTHDSVSNLIRRDILRGSVSGQDRPVR
jgi:hypothetical protein